jgi:hypothetical protein
MLLCVALVRTYILVERSASILFLRSMRRLLVTAKVVPSSLILVTLVMESLRSSETSVLTRVTQRRIAEDGFIQGGPYHIFLGRECM